jgi:hypothetical protein
VGRHQRQQHHGRRPEPVLEPAALDALDHQPVHPGVDGLARRGQGAHHMEHRDARIVQPAGEQRRVAGRGGDEADALGDKEIDD